MSASLLAAPRAASAAPSGGSGADGGSPAEGGAASPPKTAPKTEQSNSKGSHRSVAATFSAVQLLFPMLELTGELALGSRVSLSLVAGAGNITVSTLESGDKRKRKIEIWELGAQACGYLLGNFDHGMQLGLEVMYYGLALPPDAEATGTGEGLAIGPFAGYKYTAPFGFTTSAQLGLQLMTIKAEGEADGETVAEQRRVPVPLLNLNLGWAF